MNVSGPRSPLSAAYGLSPLQRPTAARPAAAVAASATATAPAAAEAAAMPKGADPQLWSVLTNEEKRFFAKQAELGPVTYGPGARQRTPDAAAVGAPRGLRIDVTA